MSITVDKLLKAKAILKANEVPPCVVQTQKEADQLTAIDPMGEQWKVGDEYYLLGDPTFGLDLRRGNFAFRG